MQRFRVRAADKDGAEALVEPLESGSDAADADTESNLELAADSPPPQLK